VQNKVRIIATKTARLYSFTSLLVVFNRPYSSNGQVYGTVVVCRRRPSIRPSLCNECIVAKR